MWNDLDLDSELRSKRMLLVPLRREHAGQLFSVLNDVRLHEFTGGIPLAFEELSVRYAALEGRRSPDGDELWLNWIAQRQLDDAVVGRMEASVCGTHAALAWVIGLRWQQKGYASEAARTIIDWLFEQVGVTEVRAHIHRSHIASERVATNAGLTVTDEIVDGERVWRLRRPLD